MKLSDEYNRRIGELVDTYRGAVPLGRCVLEATRMQASLPDLILIREDFGGIFLKITFADSSSIMLGVTEEFA
jgi:hypothetical protein